MASISAASRLLVVARLAELHVVGDHARPGLARLRIDLRVHARGRTGRSRPSLLSVRSSIADDDDVFGGGTGPRTRKRQSMVELSSERSACVASASSAAGDDENAAPISSDARRRRVRWLPRLPVSGPAGGPSSGARVGGATTSAPNAPRPLPPAGHDRQDRPAQERELDDRPGTRRRAERHQQREPAPKRKADERARPAPSTTIASTPSQPAPSCSGNPARAVAIDAA